MQIQSLVPILYTNDVAASIRFYEDVLGFTCDAKIKDNGWASLSKDSIRIMLSKPNVHQSFSASAFTGSFYFNVTNADELWNEIHSHIKICYPPETFEWGMREFAIYDNNGYVLQFGHEVNPEI